MTAISTKIIPATNSRPTRIKAESGNGNKIVVSKSACEDCLTQQNQNEENIHRVAAEMLCKKMGWKGKLAAGGTREGWVFVFVS